LPSGQVYGTSSQPPEIPNSPPPSRRNLILGIFFVTLTVVSLVSMGQLAKMNETFQKPFYTVYQNYCIYSLAFPLYYIISQFILSPCTSISPPIEDYQKNGVYGWYKFFLITIPLGLGTFIGFGLYWLALTKTSLGAVVTLLNLIPIFCYIFSVIFLGEYVSFFRIMALILCIAGAVILTVDDMLSSSGSVLGDIYVIICAVMWGGWDVVIKKLVGHCKATPFMIISVWGITALLLYWPGFIILDKTGIEPFRLPEGREIWLSLAAGIANLTELMCGMTVVLLISPLFMAISITLGTPLAFAVDMIMNGITLSLMKIFAILMIGFGFILLTISYYGYEWGRTYQFCQSKERDEEVGMTDFEETKFDKQTALTKQSLI